MPFRRTAIYFLQRTRDFDHVDTLTPIMGRQGAGRQGAGRRLTDKERLEIIELTRQDPRVRHVDLALRYSVNESTIRKWRQEANADKVQRRYVRAGRSTRDSLQRGQSSRSERFEVGLYQWLCAQRSLGRLPSGARIREEARSLATRFDGMTEFKASTGWYYRFCARFDLPSSAAEHKRLAAAAAGASVCPTTGESVPTTPDSEQSLVPASGDGRDATAHDPTVFTAGTDGALSSRCADEVSLSLPSWSSRHIHVGHVTPGVDSDGPDDSELLLALTRELEKPATPASAPSSRPAVPSRAERRMTVNQEAIAHFVEHHKGLMDVPCRLQFIKHLAHAPGEAEMYVVMDDETRVEYIKEFAARSRASAIGSVDARGHVV